MSEDNALPEWAQELVEQSQSNAVLFNELQKAFNCAPNDDARVQILSDLFSLFQEIEDRATRFSFFIKAAGLREVRSALTAKATELMGKGFIIKSVEPSKLVNILFVDTETTGLSATDEPISIGAVLCEVDADNGAILSEVVSYHGLREPFCEINPGALRVHGITKPQLKGKEFDLKELIGMFGAAKLVVAHNAEFDKGKLKAFNNAQWGCSCYEVNWPGEIGSRSLDAICRYFDIARVSPHDAMSDTRAMMEALSQKQLDGTTYLMDVIRKHQVVLDELDGY